MPPSSFRTTSSTRLSSIDEGYPLGGGLWAVGDEIVDSVGQLWRCFDAGSPGRWLKVPSAGFGATAVDDDGTPVPTPTTGDAAKVITVNEAEDGYELVVPSGGSGTSLQVATFDFTHATTNIFADGGVVAWAPTAGTIFAGFGLKVTTGFDATYDIPPPTIYLFVNGHTIGEYVMYWSADVAAFAFALIGGGSNTGTLAGHLQAAWDETLAEAVYAGTSIRVGVNDGNPTPAAPTDAGTAGVAQLSFLHY